MCCKANYELKKNEFDLGKFQKEQEGKNLVKSKKHNNNEMLDKLLKESSLKNNSDFSFSRIRNELLKRSKKSLVLRVIIC